MLPILCSTTAGLARRTLAVQNLLTAAGRQITPKGTRSFGSSRLPLQCKNPGSSPGADGAYEALGEMIKPTDFQKKVLVWGKIYKSIGEVPDRVSSTKMRKARDLFRIRVNLFMGLGTLCGCILMIMWGRHLRDSGDSLDLRGKAQLEEWARKGAEEREQQKHKEK